MVKIIRYIEHILIIGISGLTSFFIIRMLHSWQHPFITRHIQAISAYLDKPQQKIALEVALGIIFMALINCFIREFKLARKSRIAVKSGMFLYSPVQKMEKFVRKIGRGAGCNHVDILCATGWETFGAPGSPLHNVIKNCSQARIILLNPRSYAVAGRAADASLDYDEYVNHICRSIQFLESLRNTGNNPGRIQLKMYDNYPNWKYVFLDSNVLVQNYPSDENVRNSPCYAFERVAEKCIYAQLKDQFIRRWNSDHVGAYDFDRQALVTRDGCGEKVLPIVPSKLMSRGSCEPGVENVRMKGRLEDRGGIIGADMPGGKEKKMGQARRLCHLD